MTVGRRLERNFKLAPSLTQRALGSLRRGAGSAGGMTRGWVALAHDKARWCTSVLETAPGTLKAQHKPGQWLPDYKVIAENKQKKKKKD